MSRILKVAAAVVVAALVLAGAVVVYRETDLLTGSLVVLCALMIVALVARRAAVREERAGMADWTQETRASEEAAADLFGEWNATSPSRDAAEPTPPIAPVPPVAPVVPAAPTVAPPVAPHRSMPARPVPAGAEVPEPADPSVAVSRPLPADGEGDTEELVASLFRTDDPPAAAAPEVPALDDPDPLGLDQYIATPDLAMAGAAPNPAQATAPRSPIDWTGQGGRVDERVRSDDDILRASEATALPAAGESGSELSRLLAKVEARLRDYD